MEPPLKRKRLSLSPGISDDTSDVDLHEARARNDMRLKSIFEGIFEKYGRDFTDVGDEIDLRTGDITVDNGHVDALDLGEEDHAGQIDWLSHPEGQAPSNEGSEEGDEEFPDTDIVPKGNGDLPGRRVVSILSQMRPNTETSQEILDGHGDAHGDGNCGGDANEDHDSTTSEAEYFDDRSSVDSLLDTALSVQASQGTRSTREVRQGETITEKAKPQPEQFNQSHGALSERLDETVDPIWRVPEINAKCTTPTLLSRSRSRTKTKPIVSASAVRAQSPPGAGSIWALPWAARRNKDGTKTKATKQKDGTSSSPPKKRKNYHSSPPPVVCDWSFADAPDGSESDDPLQEDYEPSPTPKGSFYIREKRKGPFSAGGTKSTTTTTCSFCKKTFSEDGYVAHVRAVLADPTDNEHDSTVLKSQLATVTTDHSANGPIPNATSPGEPIARPTDTPLSTFDSQGQETANESTPSGHKRARTVLGPAEARLIIRMKQVEGMKWKEILSHLPQKKLANIQAWHHVHWSQRRTNPPQSTGPWSNAELEKLEMLKDQPELTWPSIRAELPGRLLAEIEFKLLQLWADDVS